MRVCLTKLKEFVLEMVYCLIQNFIFGHCVVTDTHNLGNVNLIYFANEPALSEKEFSILLKSYLSQTVIPIK